MVNLAKVIVARSELTLSVRKSAKTFRAANAFPFLGRNAEQVPPESPASAVPVTLAGPRRRAAAEGPPLLPDVRSFRPRTNAVAGAVRGRLKKHLRGRPAPAPGGAVPHSAQARRFSCQRTILQNFLRAGLGLDRPRLPLWQQVCQGRLLIFLHKNGSIRRNDVLNVRIIRCRRSIPS